MKPYLASPLEPRRYGLKPWARTMYLLMAAISIGLGILFVELPLSDPSGISNILWGMIAAELLLGAYYLLAASFRFVLLDRESISVSGIFHTRSLRLDEVIGQRRISSRNGPCLVIECRHPGNHRLTISNRFNFDDRFNAWLQTLPDLDAQDREDILNSISAATELGGTRKVRLQKLRSAKQVALILSILTIAAGATLLLLRQSLNLTVFGALDIFLALMPWMAVLLQAFSPLLYSSFAQKQDPRASLLLLIVISSLALLVSPFNNLQEDSLLTLIAYGSIPGLLLAFALHLSATSQDAPTNPPSTRMALLIFTLAYGAGLAIQADTQLDYSQPRQYQAQVLKKTYSSGRSTTYYLHLNAWDTLGEEKAVTVSRSLYLSVKTGDLVCIAAYDGVLRVGWFTVRRCP